MTNLNQKLIIYLKENIVPIYQSFDSAHQIDHVIKVIEDSLLIAKDYDVDMNMVYTIACFHDIGLQFGRDNHHMTGGLFLYEDPFLNTIFTTHERIMMKEAVEDHRASNDHSPRSIYGKIIAEADRQISYETICKRTIQFGFKHYQNLPMDDMIERAITHIKEKYGEQGYLKLWLKTKNNQEGLKKIHEMLKDEEKMKAFLKDIYFQEKK
jgi:uncharacterized protein